MKFMTQLLSHFFPRCEEVNVRYSSFRYSMTPKVTSVFMPKSHKEKVLKPLCCPWFTEMGHLYFVIFVLFHSLNRTKNMNQWKSGRMNMKETSKWKTAINLNRVKENWIHSVSHLIDSIEVAETFRTSQELYISDQHAISGPRCANKCFDQIFESQVST
jgi:hypothetical protein